MALITGGKFIAEALKAYGVTHVFVAPAIAREALAEMSVLGVKSIVTHGEKAAAYMADGYARAANRPGVCFAQSVGAANLAAGLQDPYLAMSPVIAMTGRKTPMEQHKNAYQEIEHSKPFASVTKFSAFVERVEQLPYLLRQAFREATSGTPMPVHLDLQGMTANVIMQTEGDLELVVEESFTRRPAFRPEASPDTVLRAAQRLSGAQRPVIVAGGGVTSSQAEQEVVELAEMLSIPVATSLNAKGAITDNHPLSVGVVGSYSRWCANRVVAEADLVIFIGSHTGSQVTNEWRIPAEGTPVIQIDIDPSELGRSYPNEVSLHGDAKATLRKLIEALEPIGGRNDWVSRAQELVKDWREEVAPRSNSEAVPIIPERLCNELTKFLPEDSLLVSDTGHAGIWTGSMVDLNHQGQGYIRCAGSLGWGLPGAIGVKCAAPDRPVVCFTGDGGLWYHIGELETAVRYNIPVVTVVNNNRGLLQNKRGDDRGYANVDGADSSELWQFNDVDLAKVAESMGALGIRVDRPGDIQSALEQALASGRPAVVDVVTDPKDSESPVPWAP
ncbi:MAG TPA: thiamine pyrophosphate-binding protein [Dehalococcoidia bacterium]|jgi:acetolactate synthase-1/2/3 large subunit|nr:thiamine pyrophosphate-binding protein [Dehalococcoidia bacterium]MEE2927895.1 thiamine pyrophosphate-binding protein [Chloroflexota bacterium]HIM47962.1 thiamine pyrophosphate-binding protein [Dehalococcoidia bacterium]|tara:strand:- start:1161 stop:2837 length:1677 start_codon:yes stop_codon:yes gene_type:complete